MPGEEGFIKLGIHSAKCIETLASDEAFADLECYVNYCYDNLMAHFRDQLPPLPDSHYRIAVLTFAGFSIVSIGQITKLKDGSLRNIRTNIRSAIKKSECKERELFLSYFPNLK